MFASRLKCKVVETRWATPSVFLVRFKPNKFFSFQPGQFVSVVIPTPSGPVKRCYSLANSPEESKLQGAYELCVKLVPGGVGSTYLSQLKPGQQFFAYAPYGAFVYEPVEAGRGVVFISTATGIAPFRSMAASRVFQASRPAHSLILYGARDEKEVLYERDFRQLGVEMVAAVSRPSAGYEGFSGRVTDYLRSLPTDFPWHRTDFYLCGNGDMVHEVSALLQAGRGVLPSAIHKENFSPKAPAAKPVAASETKDSQTIMPLPFPLKTAA